MTMIEKDRIPQDYQGLSGAIYQATALGKKAPEGNPLAQLDMDHQFTLAYIVAAGANGVLPEAEHHKALRDVMNVLVDHHNACEQNPASRFAQMDDVVAKITPDTIFTLSKMPEFNKLMWLPDKKMARPLAPSSFKRWDKKAVIAKRVKPHLTAASEVLGRIYSVGLPTFGVMLLAGFILPFEQMQPEVVGNYIETAIGVFSTAMVGFGLYFTAEIAEGMASIPIDKIKKSNADDQKLRYAMKQGLAGYDVARRYIEALPDDRPAAKQIKQAVRRRVSQPVTFCKQTYS